MANWSRQSIPVTSAVRLVLAAGITMGIASRSLWRGVAATLCRLMPLGAVSRLFSAWR